jgi:hypothetical protein
MIIIALTCIKIVCGILGFRQVTTFRSNQLAPYYPEDENSKLLRNFATSPTPQKKKHIKPHLSIPQSQRTNIKVFSYLGRVVTSLRL